jgi:hypothetical protein
MAVLDSRQILLMALPELSEEIRRLAHFHELVVVVAEPEVEPGKLLVD